MSDTAKLSSGEDWPIDFDRPLAKRGYKDITLVARFLDALKPPIDWIITSPARRARQTAETLADGLGSAAANGDGRRRVRKRLRGRTRPAGAAFRREVQHALLVGHNPTLEQLISGLCAGSPSRLETACRRRGVANLELQIMWWEQVRWGSGVLRFYLRPKLLRTL